MRAHEVVVIGGGHHGLTVAAYLAKAGVDVCVLEAQAAAASDVPELKSDIGAIWHGFIHANPLLVDDELELQAKFGLRYLTSDNQLAVLFPDDSHLSFYHDVDRTCQSIARYSVKDAEAYRRLAARAMRMLDVLTRSMFNPPPPFGAFVSMLEKSAEGRVLLRALTVSAVDICDEWFESERLKVALAKLSGEANVAPQTMGTGVVLFLFIPLTHKYGGKIPAGGSGALSAAMERCIRHHGGTIRTSSSVERVLVSAGRASGVVLRGGEPVPATRAVVCNLHPRQLVELVGAAAFPEDFVGQLARRKRSQYGAISQRLTLREAPRYRAGAAVSEALFVEVAPLSLERLLRRFDDYQYGYMHTDMPSASCQTRLDPSRARDGRHALHLFHYAPFELATGADAADGGYRPATSGPSGLASASAALAALPDESAWDDRRAAVADDILATLQQRTANMSSANVLGRSIETPHDLARRNPAMLDGDFNHIGLFAGQQLGNRHLAGWGYRTPIEQLWLCGPSCHPGGGITGGGRAAVQPVLASLGLDFARVVSR